MARPAAFNPHVHGARGLFSVMVFFFHIANSKWETFAFAGAGLVRFFFTSFEYGVELFFGISGFVIIGALRRAPSLGAFAWDRFTRIYPVLWVSLTVILVVMAALHETLPSAGDIALNYMVPPPFAWIHPINPPAWSLTWEVSFYALCAIAFTWRARRGVVPAAVALGLTVTALFPRILLMAPGVLIGTDRLTAPWVNKLARYPLAMLLLFVLAWHGLGETHRHVIRLTPLTLRFTTWLMYVPGILIVGVLGTAALKGIVDGTGVLGRLLATPLFQWLGTISYSFYLWHPLAIYIGKTLLTRAGVRPELGQYAQLVLFVVALPLALLIAWGSQHVLEAKLTRWLRLKGRRTRPTEPVVTTAEAAGQPAMRKPWVFKRRKAEGRP